MTQSKPKLKVEWLELDKLIPAVNNPKEHPPEQITQIAASIQAFGFNDPVAIDEDGVLIEGHGRLLAAQQLGLDKVPVIRLEHLSEAQKKAYSLAHNKLTLNSGWDVDKLQVEFERLQELDFKDLGLTGFLPDELASLVLDESGPTHVEPAQDAGKTEVSINYTNQYGVIITCESEAHQQQVYDELMTAGYACRVVVV